METFQNFKSQCSVTKHIIPLIKLTYYTYEWYCLKTLELRLLKVQSQQGNLRGPGNYIYTYTHTLYNPNDFQEENQTHYDHVNRGTIKNYYLCYADYLSIKPRLSQ